jgi:dTDP-4-amino-4,6-dideoxygalactose transaminase
LIEDCAQAHLACWQGKVAGSFGSAGAFSFYPTKNLGAIGDAGMLVTQDANLAARAGRLRNYGQEQRYHHLEFGMNSRLDELHAAILSERIKWLNCFTLRRRQIAAKYFGGIQSQYVRTLAKPVENAAHVFHLFVVVCEQRDALQAHLMKSNIQTLIHYPVPVHAQKPSHSLKRDPNGLPHSDQHAARCLSLPCHPQLTDAHVAQVIEAVNSFEPS